MRTRKCLVVSCLIGMAALSAAPGTLRAADAAAVLQQALGSQAPLYTFKAAELAAAVKVCAAGDAGQAGEYITLILESGRNDADAIAPSLVQAAIQGLGRNPKAGLIAEIVQAAVTAAPSEVLDIVTAAVKASPRYAAPAIVQASVKAVPHPDAMVSVNVQPREERSAGDGKETDGKQLAPVAEQMTIAEAIVQTAVNADPGLSADPLTAAVDEALGSSYASSRPAVLTTVLPPIDPFLPDPPVSP